MRYILYCLMILVLTGCIAPSVHVHPIETVDIIFVDKGETITAPKDGAFLSSEYIGHVLDAKIVR